MNTGLWNISKWWTQNLQTLYLLMTADTIKPTPDCEIRVFLYPSLCIWRLICSPSLSTDLYPISEYRKVTSVCLLLGSCVIWNTHRLKTYINSVQTDFINYDTAILSKINLFRVWGHKSVSPSSWFCYPPTACCLPVFSFNLRQRAIALESQIQISKARFHFLYVICITLPSQHEVIGCLLFLNHEVITWRYLHLKNKNR